MSPAELLLPVVAIAGEAGRRIMEIYRSADLGVQTKSDDSPVTRADLAAHRHIEQSLLSEEDVDSQQAPRRGWSRYWLVDPLDGTREFIHHRDEFTVNIALIDDGYPVLGVVVAPAIGGDSWYAAAGAGAFAVQGGTPRAIHTRALPQAPQRPVYLVSRSHQNRRLEAFLERAPPHEARSIGSSLKFCRIAEGAADFHPRTGPTSEWDTAAAQCVVEQAGGAVLALPGGERLRYNQKDSLLNPFHAVIGDPSRDWRGVLAAIGGADAR